MGDGGLGYRRKGPDHGAGGTCWPRAFPTGSTSPPQGWPEHDRTSRGALANPWCKSRSITLAKSTTRAKRPRGFLNPRTVKLFSFTTMSICIVGSVFVSILAIWDFTKSDVWCLSLATLAVIAIGTAIFAVVNEKSGD